MLPLPHIIFPPDEEEKIQETPTQPKITRQLSPTKSAQKTSDRLSPPSQKMVSIRVEKSKDTDTRHLTIPSKVAASSSSDTLTGMSVYHHV